MYTPDIEFINGLKTASDAVWYAKYSHKHFMQARKAGFGVAAAEYKTDRAAYINRARKLKET